MSKNNENYNCLFDRNGTEGMLDVILACTLIFLLISCLIGVEQKENREKELPAVQLSKTANKSIGTSSVKKNIITIKSALTEEPEIYLDDKKLSLAELKNELAKNNGINSIALRRDENIPCKWEDKVIMLCRETGVKKVGIVVQESINGK